jgi:hypothetical protein
MSVLTSFTRVEFPCRAGMRHREAAESYCSMLRSHYCRSTWSDSTLTEYVPSRRRMVLRQRVILSIWFLPGCTPASRARSARCGQCFTGVPCGGAAASARMPRTQDVEMACYVSSPECVICSRALTVLRWHLIHQAASLPAPTRVGWWANASMGRSVTLSA